MFVFSFISLNSSVTPFKHSLRLVKIALILISAFLRTFGSVIVAEALKKAPNIGLCHLIINTNVVFTLLASYFLFNQKINGKTFIGVLITLLGISTVIYYSQ